VIGVDVEYDLTSLGFNWVSEQSSYLECVSTSTKENTLATGSPINSSGTESYARTNVSIANGTVGASGTLQFKLHAFRSFGSGCSTADAKIDNNTFKVTVYHIAPPTCFRPSGITATAAPSSMLLDWTSGGASTWEVEYGAPGFAAGTGTRLAVLSKPFNVTGLNSATNYDFRVRDSCAVGDVSIWSVAQSFKTACAVVSAPFTEDFDGSDWSASGFNDLGSIDTCWSRNYQNVFTWVKGLPTFPNTNTGPAADHTSGSGKYIYTDRLGFGATPLIAEISSLSIDLSPLTTPQLVFYYHAFGSAIGDLTVEVTNDQGASYTNVFTLSGQQQNTQSDPWREAIIDLSTYANDTINVRFTVSQNSTSSFGELAIDDFSIEEAPTCPKPQNLQVDGVWTNSVDLSFTATGAVSYQFEYGAPGFTLGTGTSATSTTNPATIGGLSTNTSYEIYVRSICGPNDTSAWSTPVSFRTRCLPATAPFTQNFDGSIFKKAAAFNGSGTIDPCYFRSDSTASQYVWRVGPSINSLFNSGASVDHTTGSATGKFMSAEMLGFFGLNQGDATFTTELIDVSSLTNPQAVFWYHMFGSDIVRLTVDVITRTGSTTVFTLNGQQQTAKTDAWKEGIISLAAYSNDTIALHFTAKRNITGGFNTRIGIDDIAVETAPACPKSQNLSIVSMGSTSAQLTWLGGGATDWEIEYGAPGFTPGTGTRVAVNTNPATVTGLSNNTSYDFYVRDSCGTSNVSVWSTVASGTTACAALTAPFTENFDGSAWGLSGVTSPGTIDPCWINDTAQRYVWVTGDATTSAFNTGPGGDHTSGNGKFIGTDNPFVFPSQNNSVAFLESPFIDCNPLTTPELQFFYYMFGNQIDSLVVEVYDGSSWTTVFTVDGEQQTTGSEFWEEANIDLSAYTTNTIKVRFRGVSISQSPFSANIAIDDFSIRETPTCPRPTNLAFVSATVNDVTLSWTSGGATNWIIEYGPSGFAKGTGTFVAANSNPFTLTGLSGGVSYDIYLRDSCGVGDVSDWTNPVLASTTCAPLSTPYFENFEAADFVKPQIAVFGDSGSYPTCWNRTANSTRYFWAIGAPQFVSNFTGPNGDHTTGTGKYAFSESGAGAGVTTFITRMETPEIDLSNLTIPELSFWYHMFGSAIGDLKVEIDNGGGYTLLTTISGQQQASRTAGWLEEIVNLSAYANDTIRLRFIAEKISFSTLSDIAVDDIEIKEAPSCPKPSGLMVLGSTSTSVQLSWTSGGATDWEIEYGAPGFTPGSGTRVAVNANPTTITNLLPNTNYEFYVRDSCGAGDVSSWSAPASGRTGCAPILAPYFENFDGSTFVVGTFGANSSIDPCWLRDTSSRYVWTPATTGSAGFNSGPASDHTTGSAQYLFSDRVFTGSTIIDSERTFVESPLIDCSPLTSPELQFYYHMFGTQIDSMVVDVFDGTSWNQEWSAVGQQQTSANAAWLEANVDLAAYANDTIKIRFRAVATLAFAFSNNMAIDDFNLREKPTCPKPKNLAVTATTSSSITLGWTTGGASNWIIEYGPAGFAKGTGTFVAANSNPFTVTPLTGGTDYDFYLRDSCSATDVSEWTPVLAASTDCIPVSAPYFEDFEGAGFVKPDPLNFGDSGTYATCWDRTSSSGRYFWAIGPIPNGPTFTGPTVDHTTGTGKFAFSESGFGVGVTPFVTRVETPLIDLATLNVPELTFWYHMFGTGIGDLTVEIDNGSGYTNLTTINGQQQTVQGDAWLEEIINLSSYANDTVKLRFIAQKNSFSTASDIAIDDISIDEQPSCAKPLSIVKLGTTITTARFNWTSGVTPLNFEIEYGPVGFTPGNGTIVSSATLPFTVNGLTPDTEYDFYFRDECTAGDFSDWTGPVGDTTKCSIFSVPFAEDFEDASWVPSIVFNDPGEVNQCFSRIPVTNYHIRVGQNGTTSFNTGPDQDHTTGSGKFIHTEGIGNLTNNAIIELPIVDISPLTNPEMRFWYHMFGTNIGSVKLEGWNRNTNSWQQLTNISGAQQNASTDAWLERVVSLSSLPADTIALRFVVARTTGFGSLHDAAIDDLWIGESPTCARPSNLAFVSNTTTSIDVSWTSGGAANALIKYRPSGSALPFSFQAVTTSPATISGLIPSTSYEVYIADSCGAGDVSLFEGLLIASTACGTQSFPYEENFESGSWLSGTGFNNVGDVISDCWSRSSSTASRWGTRLGATQAFNSGPNGGANGGKYIYLINPGFATTTVQVESDEIQMPATATDPNLYFNYHMFGNNIDSLAIQVENNGAWTGNLMSIVGQQQTSKAAAWLQDSLDLTPYLGSLIRIRFIGYVNGFNSQIAIDEVEIREQAPSACLAPTALVISAVSTNSANLSWIQGGSFSNVSIVEQGQPLSTATIFNNATSPLSLTGLTPGTTYDVLVQDSCGPNLLSGISQVSFATLPCNTPVGSLGITSNNLSVDFDATATTGADSVYIDFGDGNNTSSLTSNNVYGSAGTYAISLFAYADCGSADTLYDTITVCDVLTSAFAFTQAGSLFTFDGTPSNGANGYIWDYGDGNTGAGANPNHTYAGTGNYTVTLSAYNACGDTLTSSQNVTVCVKPIVSWTYSIISTTAAGMLVQFDASASVNSVNFEWTFGDGNTASGSAVPQHLYLVPSLSYKVRCIALNSCGGSDTLAYRLNQIGLDENELSSMIKVYPIPANDILTLALAEGLPKVDKISLYDFSGKLVLELNEPIGSENTLELATSELPAGMYQLLISTQKGVVNKKVQINR
jgi:hypothetical protein